jgi:hypothetical protein
MVFFQLDKPDKVARILFNDPVGNTTRKNSAEHVYDDMMNEKAGKQRGGKPKKRPLDSVRQEQAKKKEDEGHKKQLENGPAPGKELDGLETVSTHATR